MVDYAPAQIIDYRASDAAQERLRYLLDANRSGTLTPAERAELEEAGQLNHFIANFIGARNYAIDPTQNTLKKAKFSLPEAMSLLRSLDIELIDSES